MDLKTFAASKSVSCGVCDLPTAIRKEIVEAWGAGIRTAVITKWLKEEKKISTDFNRRHFTNHFSNNHEERPNAKKP